MNLSQNSADRQNAIVNLIQSKFGENIRVIDKLHQEKKEIENKYKALQLYVNNIQNNSKFENDSIDNIKDNENKKYKNNISYRNVDEFVNAYTEDNKAEQYSAADMASLFDFEDSEASKIELLKKFNIDQGLDKEIIAIKKDKKLKTKVNKTLSILLMADQDRYILKRRGIEEKERLEKLEQEKIELEKQQRFKKASKYGKEFISMKSRGLEMSNRSKNKLLKEGRNVLQKNNDKVKENNKIKTGVVHLNTWEELLQIEQEKRDKRINDRKSILITTSRAPRWASNGNNIRKKYDTDDEIVMKKNILEDPEDVIARLEKEKKTWKLQLERTKALNKELAESNVIKTKSFSKMEEREKIMTMKREKRIEEKNRKEKIKIDQRKEADRIYMEKNFNDKNIINKKNTKMEDQKIKMVREKIEKERRGNDITIKSNNNDKNNMNEMEKIDRMIFNKNESKDNYKIQLKNNKKKIEESLRNRPSLLVRHAQQIAIQTAGGDALIKIEELTRNIMEENKNKYIDSDEEKEMKKKFDSSNGYESDERNSKEKYSRK